jgi:predicted Zn-dependent peptidase
MIKEHFEVVTLDNNLKLQFVSIPGARSTLFSVGFFAGSMYEEGFGKGSNDGISHFIEHMFFKGTPSRTTKQINDDFSRLGADLNAYTSYDHTAFYSKVPTRNLRKTAEIWKDLLRNRFIDPNEFNIEKEVVLQEIQLYKDIPEYDANYSSRKIHFSGTPLEHNILGTPNSISSMTIKMMSDYINRLYSLDNAIITITGGGFDLASEKEFFSNLFEESVWEPKIYPSYPPVVTIYPKKSKIQYISVPKSRPLCYVSLCWDSQGIKTDDFFPLLLLNTYIGNSRTSLLYREIISQGFTSACRYGFEGFYDVSVSNIVFVTLPQKANEVFQKIMNLLIQLYELTITDDIVHLLKDELWGSYLVETEDPANYGIDLLQKFIKLRQPLSSRDFHERIQVTPEEVQEAKYNYLDRLNMTVYTTGNIPKDWKPVFPDESPW